MQLVIDLDDLKTVGFAVREHPRAFAAVNRLIAASPSLTDVMGRVAAEKLESEDTAVDRILDLLIDREDWISTRVVAETLDIDRSTAMTNLKDLQALGRVERRDVDHRTGAEWRVV